jgi:hypothetical protein
MLKGSVVPDSRSAGFDPFFSIPGLGTGGKTDDRMDTTGKGELIWPGLSYRSYSPSSQRTHHEDGSSFISRWAGSKKFPRLNKVDKSPVS